MKKILQISFCILFFTSCHKDKPAQPAIDFGYNYYPNDVGRYIIYQVDSIAYDDQVHPKPDTTKYLLKELNALIFQDNSSRPTMRLERYYKYFKNGQYDTSWSVPKIWTANKTATTIERKEENTTYVKLVFPARDGKTWNGNSFNSKGEMDYDIDYADKKETINGLSFDSVLMVKQYEAIDFIEKILWAEKYARNVGMIFRQHDSLYFNGDSSAQAKQRIGYRVTQKIQSYGKQ